MNEYQRQVYLSALGIENYMPRWHLTLAPVPVVCDLPKIIIAEAQHTTSSESVNISIDTESSGSALPQSATSASVAPLMADVLRTLTQEKFASAKLSDQSLPVPQVLRAAEPVPAFTLSIWRPVNDVLVIDARNTQLAFPTEILLNNILRAVFNIQTSIGNEEVLRWPLVDNVTVARTEDDARSALQVWLEVELERRPVRQILLMGKNATRYFLSPDMNYDDILWREIALTNSSSSTIVAPSLVELLQQPELKRDLWKTLQCWRSNT